MAIAIALLTACLAGIAVCALVQQSITGAMELRLGDPPDLTFWQLAGRGRSLSIQREFRQRYPGDPLLRRLRLADLVFIACAAGALFVIFGLLPDWAGPSR